MKQIQLTEKQVQGVIAAQKDVSAIFAKMQGGPSDQVPPKVQADLEAVAVKKHGFKDFNEYDEVVDNISLVMTGIDPKTKAFTEPDGRDQEGDRGSHRQQVDSAAAKEANAGRAERGAEGREAHSVSRQRRAGDEILRQDRRGDGMN